MKKLINLPLDLLTQYNIRKNLYNEESLPEWALTMIKNFQHQEFLFANPQFEFFCKSSGKVFDVNSPELDFILHRNGMAEYYWKEPFEDENGRIYSQERYLVVGVKKIETPLKKEFPASHCSGFMSNALNTLPIIKTKPHNEVKHSNLFTANFKSDPHFLLNVFNEIAMTNKGISVKNNSVDGAVQILEVNIGDNLNLLQSIVPDIEKYMLINRELFHCDKNELLFAFDLAIQVHHEIFGFWLKYDWKRAFIIYQKFNNHESKNNNTKQFRISRRTAIQRSRRKRQ